MIGAHLQEGHFTRQWLFRWEAGRPPTGQQRDCDTRTPSRLGAAIRWEPSSVVDAHVWLFCRFTALGRRR